MIVLYLPEAPVTEVGPERSVAGLPLANRLLRASRRTGADRVIAYAPRTAPVLGREAARLGIRTLTIATSPPDWAAALETLAGDAVVTVVPAGLVVSPALLEMSRTTPPGTGDASLADVPGGDRWPRTGAYRTSVAGARDIHALAARIARRAREVVPLPTGADIARQEAVLIARARRRSDLASVEAAVRRAMYKPSDPVLARFNRRLSLPISVWLIAHTPLSANGLSLLLIVMAVAVAWAFGLGGYWSSVAGAVLSLAASILDGCDGEIARLKYEETSFGCWIETFGDYAYYVALFTGMTVGVVRATGQAAYAWVGLAALVGAVLTFVLLTGLRRSGTGGRPERLQLTARQRFTSGGAAWTKVVNELVTVATRSTMPYGILLMTVLHALPLVLVLAALGANTYWIAMLLRWPALRGLHAAAGPEGPALRARPGSVRRA